MSKLQLVNVVDEFTTSTGKKVKYYSLPNLQKSLGSKAKISRLPISIRILLESLLRNNDGKAVTDSDILALATWNAESPADREIPFKVGRVLMQDLTGVPALVDLAAMRDAAVSLKLDPRVIEPEVPIDLVIDHSIQVDVFRELNAIQINGMKEIERNKERYEFLKWAQQAFHKLKLVPPDTGICHQVNLEFLASVVMQKESGDKIVVAYPDTLVGTDSHTPMINGLGILGWGVGGIEAEAALLGQPVTFVTPKVFGVHLTGSQKDGVTATDVVLTITQKLREIGVVDSFVEFFGDGVRALTVAGRATISNMAPEFGATAALFPVDEETLRYLKLTGRSDLHIELVKRYFEVQGMFGSPSSDQIDYSQVIEIDLSQVEASVAGPTLPHERSTLGNVGKHFVESFPSIRDSLSKSARLSYEGKEYTLSNGDIVIAAITSCTNTSNPSVMIAAGLLAKRAVELGLEVRGVVKTSMAPGSMVVTEYLKATGLLPYLEKLGFGIVGYGCTTCIAQGTPVLLADGTTRTIEQMHSEGRTFLFSPSSDCRLGVAEQLEFMKQGIRECVKLVLQDGRSLICTPDHKILCSDGRWVRADEIELGKGRAVVGLEGPLDQPLGDEVGFALHADNLAFKMDNRHDRACMLAFARLVGHLLSDGSISVLGQARMNVGQAIDREVVLNDIELITGLRPIANRYDERKWSIVLPVALARAVIALPGVQVGRRIGQIPTIPQFVIDDKCPLAVVREFLGGLFGADGLAPTLHRWGKREFDATLRPAAYSKSTIPEYLQSLKEIMEEIIRLLTRCGVKTKGARICEYETRRGVSTYAKPTDGIKRIEVRLTLPDGLSFIENVGYRYCVDKALRASAAAVYWRLVNGIHLQRLWMASRVAELHQEQPTLSFSKVRQIVATEMQDYSVENNTLPPAVSSTCTLLEGYDRFSRLPKTGDRKFRPLHRKNCNLPSPIELFTELGVRQWFAPLTTWKENGRDQRYCVEKEALTMPTFSLQVVDRHSAGKRLVYDLAIADFHSFVAGTVAVHNCIGNSGPLPEPVGNAIKENSLTTAAVLSGNRNFEARIHQDVRANFLMSPPLVVAYALAGKVMIDLTKEPLGLDKDGQPVYLKDIWPSNKQVMDYQTAISTEMFRSRYAQVYNQNSEWNKLEAPTGLVYKWDEKSTYIQQPPYFIDFQKKLSQGEQEISDVMGARPLLILGDYVTTDHISPAGAFNSKSVAGKYLLSKGVPEEEFNTYGSRRGNHLVMIRGTFANPRIKNVILGSTEGSQTKHFPDGEVLPIFDASAKYQSEKVPLVVIAGRGFGTGSSRDWAAKGQKLLGVRAIIAESFERIHRSNLVGMGILPLQFKQGIGAKTLQLDGSELYDVTGIKEAVENGTGAKLTITRKNGEKMSTEIKVRIDSEVEKDYFKSGGILDYVLQKTVSRK